MSVQLIVYPQNYDGQISSFSSTSTEVLVNGINFIGLNSTSSADVPSSTNLGQFLGLYPPAIVNTWYRFRTTVYNTPSFAAEVSGNLVLDSVGASGQVDLCGVYQQLSNLTIGQNYTVTIEISIPSAVGGGIFVAIFDGTTPSPGVSQVFVASVPQITSTFTATSTNNTVMITFLSSNTETVTISSISINPEGVTPNLTTFELTNGQVICDLYEDEDIPLSLSVDNFKNVAEKVQSYSKAFKLPATKRNNLIFDNMFEITRSDDGIIFNPYNKTECVLKQDGFILFKGYLKMLDITDKEGEISYNVNLYSEVVALADILKDRTFSELDFTELTHDYNKTQIKYSWNDSGTGITYTNPSTSGYRNAYSTVKYPFVDWNHQFIVANNPGAPPASGPADGNPQLPNLESAFRPFIQLKYLINRIFEATPFTWESSFFDSTEFGKLFMDFNWGSDNTPQEIDITTFETYYTFNAGDGSAANYAGTSFSLLHLSYNIPWTGGLTPPNYNDSTNVLTSTVINESYTVTYAYDIVNTDTVSRNIELRWLHNSTPINPTGTITLLAGASYTYQGTFTQIMLTTGETLQAEFKADAGSVVAQSQVVFPAGSGASVVWTLSAEATTGNTILQTLRGELGQWDFLKGIMTMFNLVSLPNEDNPNIIKFEPYGDVFISDTAGITLSGRSIQHDWTDKIDISEMKLTPLTDLNKNTIFKFVEDEDDFCFMEYKRQVGGHLYGSKKFDASLSSGGLATVLQGTNEVIAEPFAATISSTLMPQYPGIVIPKIYASSDNETEGFDNSPRILYNNGIKPTGITYYIPAQNGLFSENQANYLQFSHLTDIPTIISSPPAITDTSDFHFGMCQLPNGLGASTPRNLFNLYWLPYYQELYNPDTRTMTIKVNLSPSIINTFKFNDTVMIKNREFRVNKIDYKPNDLATVEFILIP
jgi:hypothetical protein